MNWTLTDSTNRVAYRVLDNGQMESVLVSALPAGTVIDPYVAPPPPVPTIVSRFQARAALVQAGHFDAIDAYMSTLPRTHIQRMAWDEAADFDRTSTTLAAMAQMLGLDDAALDALFVLAASIEA
ncbi:hypothetical protein UFOVP73_3 [uncultured Caudovirales phage]|uniref:Uncharacterized protein n=1 Tax=uncultured Caudovirales phage TaxID=2100421 RepID=A0A6J5KU74_9CAUD|nr:hypothetical protein UFOVP73_3 [uncultured Caudovirales phage]CAB5194813.1 hypothetical protein UFOVP170_25 [uncultured Caudovirales phage]